jgi:hypothetical protein
MMACGQLFKCARLTLLYPHHSGLAGEERVHASHRISGHDARLETATFNVAAGGQAMSRLRNLLWNPQSQGSPAQEDEEPFAFKEAASIQSSTQASACTVGHRVRKLWFSSSM